MKENENTRERIKAAAMEVFIERGFDGARMQEIADRAGANKAMIYYYWDSKEALFEAIVSETLAELFQMFSRFLETEVIDPQVVVPLLVQTHLRFLQENQHLLRIIVREIHSGNPVVERLVKRYFTRTIKSSLGEIGKKVENAVAKGVIRPVDPRQTIWNIVALNLFIFVMQPILSAAWPEDFANPDELLRQREKAVVDLLLYGLLPR